MPKIAEYAAAALIEASIGLPGGLSVPAERLSLVLQETMNVEFPEDVITAAVKILRECEIAYAADDDFAGRFVVISGQRFQRFLERVEEERAKYDSFVAGSPNQNIGISRAEDAYLPYLEAFGKYSVIRKYSEFGQEWLNIALRRIKSQPDLATAEIPASDRVVRIDDNDPGAVAIRAAACELRQRIRTGNDLGAITAEQAQAVAAEVGQLEEAFSGGVVRSQVVIDRAKKTLSWIGEKAAGTLVGTAATALLALILSYFGLV